jgi:hypothetical protein
MKVFPNPNNGKFKVIIKDLTRESTLQITDLVGRIVHQSLVKIDNKEISIDLDSVLNGIYLLTMYNSQLRITQRMHIE